MFDKPDMAVRIYSHGTPEVHSSGSSDACVELVAHDGRIVQVVFHEDGSVMLRGWCGTYKRIEQESEMDLYSRGEVGDETLNFYAQLPPVPDPVREARDARLAAIREERQLQAEAVEHERRHRGVLGRSGQRLRRDVLPRLTAPSPQGF